MMKHRMLFMMKRPLPLMPLIMMPRMTRSHCHCPLSLMPRMTMFTKLFVMPSRQPFQLRQLRQKRQAADGRQMGDG
jgi:hypothetical protein